MKEKKTIRENLKRPKQGHQTTIYLSNEVFGAVTKLAMKERRSLSNQIETCLRAHFGI